MIEYRVRKITRFIVTEYVEDRDNNIGSVSDVGIYDSLDKANRVAAVFHKACEHEDKHLLTISQIDASRATTDAHSMVFAARWSPAPHKSQWGEGMMVADIHLSNDETLTIFAHRDEIERIKNL